MPNIVSSFFLTIVCLAIIGRLRTYIRTGMKGELLISIGGMILVLGGLIDNWLLGIGGFIIINVGLIILATIEHDMRKEIFRHTTLIERLTGNVPKITSGASFQMTYNKKMGIITGILCIVIALIYYKQQTASEVIETVFILLLAFTGIFFIVFSLLRKDGG